MVELEPKIDVVDNKINKFSKWLEYLAQIKRDVSPASRDLVILDDIKREFDEYFGVRGLEENNG